MGTMLIGYDVEWLGDGDVTPRFIEQARTLHKRLGGVQETNRCWDSETMDEWSHPRVISNLPKVVLVVWVEATTLTVITSRRPKW